MANAQPQPTPSITDWLTAIGTVGAVIAALILAIQGSLSRWYSRPILAVEFKQVAPFCRYSPTEEASVFWVRVRVRNKGRSVAKRCEGRLEAIIDEKSGKEEVEDFDPVILHWVGRGRGPIDINKQEGEYLDVFFLPANQMGRFIIYDEGVETRGIQLARPKKDTRLRIAIYGENVEPVTGTLSAKFGTKWDECQVQLVD